jgi:hypothetical protein
MNHESKRRQSSASSSSRRGSSCRSVAERAGRSGGVGGSVARRAGVLGRCACHAEVGLMPSDGSGSVWRGSVAGVAGWAAAPRGHCSAVKASGQWAGWHRRRLCAPSSRSDSHRSC